VKSSLALFSLLVATTTTPALAGEEVFVFRSVEDASVPADPSVCASAPFAANLRLVASLYAVNTRSRDGKVVNDEVRRVGTANACGQITNFAFPPGLQQNFHLRFDLNDGSSYTATGTCTLTSNTVPKGGVVLAGCALRIIDGPPGTLGGVVSSASVFNPFRLTGFNTGSLWTMHVYDDSPDRRHPHHHRHARDFELFEDTRTDEEIAALKQRQEQER
jgi:hypothetical protein